MKKTLFLFLALSLASINNFITAQDTTKQADVIKSFHIQYGFHLPGGDMDERYGINQVAGLAASFKTKSNWMFDVDFSYLFGGNVKIHDSIFAIIANDDGYIIDGNGQFAELYTYERGYYITLGVSKILPIFAANVNSGVTIGAGAGFMQHKIRVYNPDNIAPQVCGEYSKGYDYLTNGTALKQFVGYTFFAPKKVYSFKAGFELVEAFTQGRRDYLFPIGGPDTEKRVEFLYGFKLMWTIPFMKSTSETYYYY